MIGKVLLNYVREGFGIILSRDAFLLGCVLPDYGVKFITKPHIQKNYGTYVKKQIQHLMNTELDQALVGSTYSRRMGMICHFYADFFCCPHSRNMYCGVMDHVKYERELWHFMQMNFDAFELHENKLNKTICQTAEQKGLTSDFIYNLFEDLHSDYLKEEPAFKTDLSYCVKACAEMLEMTLYASALRANEQKPILMPMLQAV